MKTERNNWKKPDKKWISNLEKRNYPSEVEVSLTAMESRRQWHSTLKVLWKSIFLKMGEF